LKDVAWGKRVCLRGVPLSRLRVHRDSSVELAEDASVDQAVEDCIAAAVQGDRTIIFLGSTIDGTISERREYVYGCSRASMSGQLGQKQGEDDAQTSTHGA
jgi:hypothetical protein